MDLLDEVWLKAHATLAAATCGHGQNDARYVMDGESLLAVTHEEGSDVFSIFTTTAESDYGDVTETHISGRAARILAAFFCEFPLADHS